MFRARAMSAWWLAMVASLAAPFVVPVTGADHAAICCALNAFSSLQITRRASTAAIFSACSSIVGAPSAFTVKRKLPFGAVGEFAPLAGLVLMDLALAAFASFAAARRASWAAIFAWCCAIEGAFAALNGPVGAPPGWPMLLALITRSLRMSPRRTVAAMFFSRMAVGLAFSPLVPLKAKGLAAFSMVGGLGGLRRVG